MYIIYFHKYTSTHISNKISFFLRNQKLILIMFKQMTLLVYHQNHGLDIFSKIVYYSWSDRERFVARTIEIYQEKADLS